MQIDLEDLYFGCHQVSIIICSFWQLIYDKKSAVIILLSLHLRLRRKHFTLNILLANFRIFLYTWHYLMHSGPLKKTPRVVFNIFHTAYASKKMESLCLQLLRLEHIYTTRECSYRGATARRLNAHRHIMSQRLIYFGKASDTFFSRGDVPKGVSHTSGTPLSAMWSELIVSYTTFSNLPFHTFYFFCWKNFLDNHGKSCFFTAYQGHCLF